MERERRVALLHACVIVLCAGLLAALDHAGRSARHVPERSAGRPLTASVASQADTYTVYKAWRLAGARVVHLNRFMNLVEHYPAEEERSVPFPIPTPDIRPGYEKGIDPHNWLFIANRTGMVRAVNVVLPEAAFREKAELFRTNFFYRFRGPRVEGRARDLPFEVSRLEDLPVIEEPVVVNVDAGYFDPGSDAAAVAARLRASCRDVRALVLIGSEDEPEVTLTMRRLLREFAEAFLAAPAAAAVDR